MPNFIINELPAGRARFYIEQNSTQSTYTFSVAELTAIEADCRRLINKPLHTRNEADYKFVLAAGKENAENIITNDHDIRRYLQKFQFTSKGFTKRPTIFNTAGILHFILELDKSIFSLEDFADSNLTIFKVDQLKSWASMLLHFKNFNNVDEMNFWLEDIQNSFDPYKSNVLDGIKAIGGANGN